MTDKQKQFVNFYLGRAHFNATKAAELAGYAFPMQQGYETKNHPEVAELIRQRLESETLKADEVLRILSEQARGNIREFIEPLHGGNWLFDIQGDDKPMHLVKSLTMSKRGNKIELYDAQAALVHIGRHYKIFTDRQEIDANVAITPYQDLTDDELESQLATAEGRETSEAS
jgi:hypothetical protein